MRKGNWFSSVSLCIIISEPDEKKEQGENKSKNNWFWKQKQSTQISPSLDTVNAPLISGSEEVKLSNVEYEQTKQADPVVDTAALEALRDITVSEFVGKSMEEVAAIKIQTAFRGHLARRALLSLRGLLRLTSLVHGQSVKRQAVNTLRCMQTLSRVQSQISCRRIRMLEENQALYRQLQHKHAKELQNLRMGKEWDDSRQSKKQIETNLLSKQEAAMRRERALAYAFSHRQNMKNSSSKNPNMMLFMDSNNPTWGWTWLERWMIAGPWESANTMAHELNNHRNIPGREIIKPINGRKISSSKFTLAETMDKTAHTAKKQLSSIKTGNLKYASPRTSFSGRHDDVDLKSMRSEVNRPRHSNAGSSLRDDESMASSTSVPSYIGPTKSARARLRSPSPLSVEKSGAPEKVSTGLVKKRVSCSGSQVRPRRLPVHQRCRSVDNNEFIAKLSVRN